MVEDVVFDSKCILKTRFVYSCRVGWEIVQPMLLGR